MIKVSLIITVFNRKHLLRKALLSLRQQSELPDEIIISDDGSEEDILKGIADIVGQMHIPMKFVTQENKGFRLAKCRNNGVRISSGNFLIFMDQDLIQSKNYIKTFISNQKTKTFITSYPIRLTENQSLSITEKKIIDNDYINIITKAQTNKIKRQFLKDNFSSFLNKINLDKNKPKIRGGACAINRIDYEAVNGYDENFTSWGSEDDDMKRRLNKYGVSGINPFYNEYPLHLHHEPFHINGERNNKLYNDRRKTEIGKGEYYCRFGLFNPLGDDKIGLIELN